MCVNHSKWCQYIVKYCIYFSLSRHLYSKALACLIIIKNKLKGHVSSIQMELICCHVLAALLYLILFVFLPLPLAKSTLHYLITEITFLLLIYCQFFCYFILLTKISDKHIQHVISNKTEYNLLNIIKAILVHLILNIL